MVNSTATTPSQSHGGALYYVVEVPREEYLKECAAQATAMASAGGYPNPTYQAQYAAHHQQFQNVPNTTILARLNRWAHASQLQAAAAQQNGTKSPHKSPGTAAGGAAGSPALGAKNGTTGADGSTVHSSTTPISNQVIPGPQSASHVVIDEKKKKKCTCCVIQ
uniref:Uncharacterized protein n=1 Tax=Anopheles coluzzii TaxID=1518534 RepID=A0A8W7NYE9_ANOCL